MSFLDRISRTASAIVLLRYCRGLEVVNENIYSKASKPGACLGFHRSRCCNVRLGFTPGCSSFPPSDYFLLALNESLIRSERVQFNQVALTARLSTIFKEKISKPEHD